MAGFSSGSALRQAVAGESDVPNPKRHPGPAEGIQVELRIATKVCCTNDWRAEDMPLAEWRGEDEKSRSNDKQVGLAGNKMYRALKVGDNNHVARHIVRICADRGGSMLVEG